MGDSYYDDMRPEQVGLYQHYFLKIIQNVDVANNTRWARGETYDRVRLAADDDAMYSMIVGDAARSGLSPAYLQTLINQFFFADPFLREQHKDNWVNRVLNRADVDGFPDGWSMRRVLEKLSGD